MMNEDEITQLLRNIPCSFSLGATVMKKTKSSLEAITCKLLKEDQTCIYDTQEEIIRDHNLLSYLFWCTGKVENAFEFNKKVLKMSDKNVTAAVNKIWFYLELHNPYEAKTAFEHFQTLKQDKNFESICLTGEAEIAYAYTRFGFRHYRLAVEEFKKVLRKADQLPDIDKNSVYLWKAGLGLTLRRLSHFGNVGNPSEMQRTKERLREAIEIFVELVESDWDSKRNKAFSYVQLAQAVESAESENLPLNEYIPAPYRSWDIETFYHMAECHCKGDTYTLERYGKFLRQKYKLNEAEEKLRASISIMPTSTAHHYLALVLKSKLDNNLKNSQRNRPHGTSFIRPRATEHHRYGTQDNRPHDLKNSQRIRPHGTSFIRPRATEHHRYGTQDYRPHRYDFYAKQDARTGRRFQDQRMETKGQSQRYPRSQQPSTSTKSMERETNTSMIRSKVKCPTTVLPYPKEDANVSEILYHLDKATLLGDNRAATYDKGLILRATGDFDGAIATFQSLIKIETSLMYLANAYEQSALCIQSKLDDVSISLEEKEKLTYDRKSYLMAAVANSAKMVARMPNITKIWYAGTSLKHILAGEGKSKENLKMLALLSERLSEYKDAIGYYQELLLLDKSEQENPETLMKIIRNQMKDGNFIEAVSVFDLIMVTPNGKRYIDEKLYCSALIEAGFERVREKDESNVVLGYLKTVLNHSSGLLDKEADSKAERGSEESHSYQNPVASDEENFDVFILCSEIDDTTLRSAKQMVEFLKAKCNVKATLNKEDVIPGRLELSTMLNFISQSQNVVVCLDETSEGGIIRRGIEHVAREKSNVVVVLMSTNTSIPNCLMGFPSIVYEIRDEISTEIGWMKSLFYKLAGCRECAN